MPGALKKYAFINAKLRARISKVLPEERLRQMARAATLSEAVGMLHDTEYAALEAVYTQTGDIKLAELELLRREVRVYVELESLVEAEAAQLVRALTTRFEVETLKNALRLWFDSRIRGRRIEGALGYLLRERVHYDLQPERLVNASSLEEVAVALEGTPYSSIVARVAPRVLETQSLFPVEIALDHHYYRLLLAAIAELEARDRQIARRLIGVEIDMENISWLIRFKSFFDLPLKEALEYSIPWGLNLSRELMTESYQSEQPGEVLSAVVRKRYPELAGLLSSQQRAETRVQFSRLVLMERILEQIMLLEVRRILTGYPFTIGIILAYFIIKANEIGKIMSILNGKFYNWPEERIMAAI
jgi:V/A-type H+-transporting ATPase subunit C